MGCSGSSRAADAYLPASKVHDVCVTSTCPVLTSEDFAAFFSVWIMKVCAETGLSVASGRPKYGTAPLVDGSREHKALRLAVLTSRVTVCIANITKSGSWPPSGYANEVTWAQEHSIPIVAFYDGDRYGWKDVCYWKGELPALFRAGVDPVKYHRNQHDFAKEQLQAALRLALREASRSNGGGSESETESVGPPPLALKELSRAERRLMRGEKPPHASNAEEDGEEGFLGLQRSDFERTGLVQRKLERTNSLRDINVETALAMLAKKAAVHPDEARGAVGDALMAREGGCRLQFVNGKGPNDQALLLHEPAHRVLRPAYGILKKRQEKRQQQGQQPQAGAGGRQLRLSASESQDRRHAFAVQQLEQHLDSLQVDDVHEFMTVQRCLQDGVDECTLVIRSMRLIRAFLESHLSLHPRALQQGVVPAVTAAMRKHADIDVYVGGTAALFALLEAWEKRGGVDLDIDPEDEADANSCVVLVAKFGGPEVISNAMKLFPTCELLQEHGVRSFGLLCQVGDGNKVSAGYKKGNKQESNVVLRSQARRLVARHGGAALCIGAMKKFPNNAKLQAGGCMALGRIGSVEARVKKRAAKDGGAVAAVMAALTRHKQDADVQRWGCASLRHLASNSQDIKTYIGQRGGVEGLCAAVGSYRMKDHAVAAEALGALCHLASKHPDNKRRIFEARALELTVGCLQDHPQDDVAMAGCGLLHNLACDEDIKRHIVKLGGREIAEHLTSCEVQAVRNLARVLQRTLAPAKDPGDDPFGAIFATRAAGGPTMRATSRRDRKKAMAALKSIDKEEADTCDERSRADAAVSGSDAASECGESVVSIASTASGSSGLSAGSKRRPGRPREISSRRFAKLWDGGGAPAAEQQHTPTQADGPVLRRPPEAPPQPPACDYLDDGEEPNDSHGCVAKSESVALSETSDAESHLSLEALSCLGDSDMLGVIEQLSCVRIRQESGRRVGPGRQVLGQRAAERRAATNDKDPPNPEKRKGSKGLANRFVKSLGGFEEMLTEELDRFGQSARRHAKAEKSQTSREPC